MSRGSGLTINISDDEEERKQNGRHQHVYQSSIPLSVTEQSKPTNRTAESNQSNRDSVRPLKKRYAETSNMNQFREQKKDARTDNLLKIPFMNRVTGLPPEAVAASPTGTSSKSNLATGQTPTGSWHLIPTPTFPGSQAYSKDGVFYQPTNPEGYPWIEMPRSQEQFMRHLAQQQMQMMHMIGQQNQLARMQQPSILVNAEHLSVVTNAGLGGNLKEVSSSHGPKHSASSTASNLLSSSVAHVSSSNIPDHVLQLAQKSGKSKKRGSPEAISSPHNVHHIEKTVNSQFDHMRVAKRKSAVHDRSSSDDSVILETVGIIRRDSSESSAVGTVDIQRKESTEKLCEPSSRPEQSITEDQNSEKSTKDSDGCNLTILETFSLRDCSTLSDNSESGSGALDLSLKTLNRSGSDFSSTFESQELSPTVAESRKSTGAGQADSCLLDELCKKAFYQCCNENCKFSTVHPTEFEVHLSEVHTNSSCFMCVHCGHASKSSDSLLKHLHDHIRDDLEKSTLTCSYKSCPFQTKKPEVLIRHINIDHQREQHHVCCKCNETFRKCFDLLTHMKGHFLTVAKCPHCPAKDVSKKTILRHMNQCHQDKGSMANVLRFIICRDRSLNRWPLSLSLLKEKSDKEDLRAMSELSPLKLPKRASDENKLIQSPEMPNLTNDCYPKASEDPLLQKSSVSTPQVTSPVVTVSNNGKEYVPIMSVKVASTGIEVEKIPSNESRCEAPANTNEGSEVGETSIIKKEPQDNDFEVPLKTCMIKKEPSENIDHYLSPSAVSRENKSLLQKVNVCNKCEFYTSSNGAIYRHLKTVHKIDDMFQCSECRRCVAQDDVIEHHAKFHPTSDENYIPTSISNCYRIKYMQKSLYKLEKEKKKSFERKRNYAMPVVPLDDIASGLLGRFNSAKEGDVVKLSSMETNFFEQLMQVKSAKKAKIPLPQETSEQTLVHQVTSEESNVLQDNSEEPNVIQETLDAPSVRKVTPEKIPTKKSPVGKSPLHKNRKKKRASLFTVKKRRGQTKRPRVDSNVDGRKAKKRKSVETQKSDSSPEDNTEEFEQNYDEFEADDTEQNPNESIEEPPETTQEQHDTEEHHTEEQHEDADRSEPEAYEQPQDNQIESQEDLLRQSHQAPMEQTQGVPADLAQCDQLHQDDQEHPSNRRSSPRMTRNKLLSVYYKDQDSSTEDSSSEDLQRGINNSLQDLANGHGMSRDSDNDNNEIESLPDLDSPVHEISLNNTVSSNMSIETFGVNNNLEPKDFKLQNKKKMKIKRKSQSPKAKDEKAIKTEQLSPNKLILVQASPGSNWTVKKSPIKSPVKRKIIPTEDNTTAPNLTFSQVNFDDENYEFRCKYCTYRRGTLDKFLHHTYYHFHYRPYACGFCTFKAFSHNRILTHINTDHPKQVKNPIVKRVENEKAEARCQKTAMICFIPKHIDDVSLRIRLEKKKQKALLKKQIKKENNGSIKELKIKKEPKKKGLKKLSSAKTSVRKGPVKMRIMKNQSEGSYLCPYCRTNRPLMTWNKLVIEVCYHIHYKPFTCPYCSDCDTASKMCLEKHIERFHKKQEVVVKENRDPAKEIRLKQLLQRSMDLSKKYRQDKKHQELLVRAKRGRKKMKKLKQELPVLPVLKKVEPVEDPESPIPNTVAVSEVAEVSGDTAASTLITSETIEKTIAAVFVSRNGQLEPQAPLPVDRRIRKSEELFKEVLDDYGAPLYECLKCDHTIRNLKSMYTHSYKHQPRIFKCAYCELTSYPRSAIVWHQKKFHRGLKSNVINMSTLKF